jgi:transcriptional regulator with XRE-family HTH domain
MSDNPTDPLINQLARRVRDWLNATEMSQRALAQAIGTSDPNLSSFLAGKSSLSAGKILRLSQILNSSKAQSEKKFGGKKLDGRIIELQERGRKMQLASDGRSWVPGLVDGGSDPNNSTTITGTNANPARTVPDDDDWEFLAGLAGLHQEIIERIKARQAQQKAKPNPQGSTEAPRHIDDNTKSRMPGPRGDRFSRR